MYNNESLLKQLGRNIKAERVRKGYTQESLAELMNKSWSSIAKLETSAQNISIGKLVEIGEYLNVDFKEFLK